MRDCQAGTVLGHEAVLKRRSARLLGVVFASIIPCLSGTSFAQAEPAAAAASADADAPVRLLVLGNVPEFVTRVRGQVSDLDVLIEIDTSLARAPRAAQGDTLIELAARHEADVIAWLGEARDDASASSASADRVDRDSAHAVHVWVAARRQVYSRRIGPLQVSRPSPRPAGDSHPSALDARPPVAIGSERSATLETAALVVRSAVRSVLFEQSGAGDSANAAAMASEAPPISGGALPAASIAVPEAAVTTARRVPTAGSVDEGEGSAGASTRGRSAPLAWAAHAGLDWTYAGLSRSGTWSLDAGLALHLQPLRFGVGGSYGFPEIVQHENVQLQLGRQTLLAEVGWEALSLPHFALLPTLQVGVARFTRSSSTSEPDRLAAPAESSFSALASLELVAQYELTGALRLSWGAGVDYLSHVPRYVVGGPGAQQISALEAWRWQPNAGIALGAVF